MSDGAHSPGCSMPSKSVVDQLSSDSPCGSESSRFVDNTSPLLRCHGWLISFVVFAFSVLLLSFRVHDFNFFSLFLMVKLFSTMQLHFLCVFHVPNNFGLGSGNLVMVLILNQFWN